MFDFIRNHKRLMLICLVLFIVPGLGLVGIQGFHSFFSQDANVARVNGQPISRQEYDAALRDVLNQIRQISGKTPDAAEMSEIRTNVLDQLIQQRLVAAEAQRKRLTVSDASVRQAILSIPAIAPLIQPDGSIDSQQYRQLLAAQGMTPEQLDARVRHSLAAAQIAQSIAASAFAPEGAARRLNALLEQQREVQVRLFRPLDYEAKVQQTLLDDAQLKEYYDAHLSEFEVPETATIDYVVLSPEALAESFSPSEAELEKAYQDKIINDRSGEQIRARHILIARPPKSTAEARHQALEKARAVLARVRAQPERFAEIARAHSQDPGSAKQGGDLGYFGAGMMVKPFEEAAFKLKKNEISDLVESEFGYHIIQVTDIKPAVPPAFNAVKSRLIADLKKQYGAQSFSEAAERFSNLVYEQARRLNPAAERFGLKIQTAKVGHEPNPSLSATDPLNYPKFLEAVFSNQEVLNGKSNTAAVDIGGSTLIAAHVTHYQPSFRHAFESVKPHIRQKIIALHALEAARKEGESQLKVLRSTYATDGFSAPFKVSRMNPQGMPETALNTLFKTDTRRFPQYVGVKLGDESGGGYAIYRINAVRMPSLEPQKAEAIQRQLAQLTGQLEWDAYLASLRARSSVKMYPLPELNP